VSRAGWLLASGLLAGACASPSPAPPTPRRAATTTPSRFAVLGDASPADTGPPTLRIDSQVVTIRGMGVQAEGGRLYGDVDLTEPHTLRLTLYDSLPGRPIADPPPPSRYDRQVIWEARIGPLAPGPYEVWVGRFDPRARMLEIAHEPMRIEVERSASVDSSRVAGDSSSSK
jgi:hypothetical protein